MAKVYIPNMGEKMTGKISPSREALRRFCDNERNHSLALHIFS